MMADYVTAEQFQSFRLEEDRHHTENEREIVEIKNGVKGIRKTLFGNGDPGWDEMLRELWRDLQERKQATKDSAKENKAEGRKYIYWAITFILSQAAGIWIALNILKDAAK